MIIVKKGVGSAVYEKDKHKEVHDPYSRKEFEKGWKNREYILNGGKVPAIMGGGSYNPIDSGGIRELADFKRDMEKAKRNFERGAPVKLSPQMKNELWRKLKKIKDKVIVGMIPRDELHPVRITQKIVNGVSKTVSVVDEERLRATRAVERNEAWYKKNENLLREAKRILRILEPDDKNITKVIENWRPKTRRKK